MSGTQEMFRVSADDGWLICTRCDGYGEISNTPCPECSGEGLVNREDDYS